MDADVPDAETLLRAVALTDAGERVGPVVDVDDKKPDGRPAWVWVRSGIDVADVSIVPLMEAHHHGGTLVLSYTLDQVDGAPRHPAGAELSPADQQELREHYTRSVAPAVISPVAGGRHASTGDDGVGEWVQPRRGWFHRLIALLSRHEG